MAETQTQENWFLAHDGDRIGPVTWPEIKSLYDAGKIARTDLLWCPEFSDWKRASEVFRIPVEPPQLPHAPAAIAGQASQKGAADAGLGTSYKTGLSSNIDVAGFRLIFDRMRVVDIQSTQKVDVDGYSGGGGGSINFGTGYISSPSLKMKVASQTIQRFIVQGDDGIECNFDFTPSEFAARVGNNLVRVKVTYKQNTCGFLLYNIASGIYFRYWSPRLDELCRSLVIHRRPTPRFVVRSRWAALLSVVAFGGTIWLAQNGLLPSSLAAGIGIASLVLAAILLSFLALNKLSSVLIVPSLKKEKFTKEIAPILEAEIIAFGVSDAAAKDFLTP